ncbi:DUF1758 domain-containing protein [Trichonephila clavipes]|nr:DUF1758 domain-containing protein [Trichonephila clavipes]
MDSCQNAISETLLLSDDGERLFAEDLEDAEIYREKFWELTTKIELKSQECTVPSDKESRKFKFPKIELKKFNGEWRAACLMKCWSPRKEAEIIKQNPRDPFFRTVDELSSARGERRGDGSFGADRPHPPPESMKKGLSCNTGNSVELESGLTAIETKLGWTVFGKGSCVKDNILTTLSMHSMNILVNKLCQLEVLGISSPTENEKQKTELSLNDFNNKMKILPDGRYEIELPWKYDSLKLPKWYPIGISADIEKTFLMLSVAPKDRDFLRFLFPCSEGRIVYRHCRVVFGVSSSPLLLNASIMHLLENCQPQHEEVAQKLKCSFYVDNCVSGVFNTDEQGRFNLRDFESNVAGKNVDRSSGDTSVLGVIWNFETDTLKCCTDMDTLACETKIKKINFGNCAEIF